MLPVLVRRTYSATNACICVGSVNFDIVAINVGFEHNVIIRADIEDESGRGVDAAMLVLVVDGTSEE